MKEEVIQYIGVDSLSDAERAILDKISTENHEKLAITLNNLTSLAIHVKTYDSDGARKKYSVHIRVIAPTQHFESTRASDWDFARTLHKAFDDVQRQIQHKLHTDDQRPRGR